MKKLCFLFVIILSFTFISCVSLKDASVLKNGNIRDYKYIVVNSTDTLNSSTGGMVNGIYYSIGKSVNPKDIITGYLIKEGFIIFPEKNVELLDKTLIVNYGESGRRNVFWGYTTEVTIQFLTAKSNDIICVTTAEGIGVTEADDIKKAINRALDAVFVE